MKVPIAATDSTDSGHVAPTDKGIEFCSNTISDLLYFATSTWGSVVVVHFENRAGWLHSEAQ